MAKQSIDGFTLKRHDGANAQNLGGSQHARPTLDIMSRAADRPEILSAKPQVAPVVLNAVAKQPKKPAKADDQALSRDDINESLNNASITPDTPPPATPKVTKRDLKRHTKRDQKLRDKLNQKKGHHRKRKIVKWTILALLLLLLSGVGYFVWKTAETACKVTGEANCNVFKVIGNITKTQELKTDANGRTNILIFGTSGYTMEQDAWDGAFLTDSIMVLSVDSKNNNAYMMSLPRDLWVNHECRALGTSAGKLNETFYCAYTDNGEDQEAGARALMAQAGEVLGLDIQYYIHADWTALIGLVDAVGGVDVEIESDDPRGIYDVSTNLRLPNGTNHLNGERALALARARQSEGGYGLASGNFARESNQQAILVALQKKVVSTGTLLNPVALNNILNTLGNNINTSFTTSDFQAAINSIKKMNDAISLPFIERPDNESDLMITGMVGEASVVMPSAGLFDYSEIQAYIMQNISSNPVSREAAVIDVLNGSNTNGLAQTKADELKADGFKIGQIDNAPSSAIDTVTIYQVNADKTATTAELEKRFNSTTVTGAPDGYTTDADFVLIFGAQ
jgi:LCP family protein required for cell wall assembly